MSWRCSGKLLQSSSSMVSEFSLLPDTKAAIRVSLAGWCCLAPSSSNSFSDALVMESEASDVARFVVHDEPLEETASVSIQSVSESTPSIVGEPLPSRRGLLTLSERDLLLRMLQPFPWHCRCSSRKKILTQKNCDQEAEVPHIIPPPPEIPWNRPHDTTSRETSTAQGSKTRPNQIGAHPSNPSKHSSSSFSSSIDANRNPWKRAYIHTTHAPASHTSSTWSNS